MNGFIINRLTKVLLVTLAISLLACMCLLVTACKPERHKHVFESEATVEPTCNKVGKMTYRCAKCDYSYSAELPTTEHSYKYISSGIEHWQVCSVCSDETARTAHAYTEVVSSTPSTCQTAGLAIKKCFCGNTTNEALPIAEHSFTVTKYDGDDHWLECSTCLNQEESSIQAHKFEVGKITEQSTCTTNGSQEYVCGCGASKTEQLPLIPHTYTKVKFDGDAHWFVCSVCDAVKPNQSAAPHEFTVTTVEPECEKAGSVTTTCSGCNYKNVETVKALEHELNTAAFSKNSTGSGHYYKCSRCGKDIAVPHTMAALDACPLGHEQREAKCYQKGHADEQCSVCDWKICVSIPMTNDHNFGATWESNGTFHWHTCSNGDGQCTARGDEAQHSFISKRNEPTCTENGREWRECEQCGCEQSGSNKNLPKTGHDYVVISTIVEATCTQSGEREERCEACGDTQIVQVAQLKHDWTAYAYDNNGHWRRCSNCGTEQDKLTISNHTADNTVADVIVQQGDCETDGIVEHTCQFCKGKYTVTTKAKGHNYVTDEPDYSDTTKFADPTCTEYGWYMATCSNCGDNTKILGNTLDSHSIIYFPRKTATDEETGNIPYWQCVVCEKYFSSKNCQTEYTEEQIFTYPPAVIKSDSIANLIEIAKQLTDKAESDDYYLITAVVGATEYDANALLLDDGTETIYVTLIERENIRTISEDNTITLKGKLLRNGNSITLVNCKVVSVECGDEELHSLFLTVSDYPGYEIYLSVYSETCSSFSLNSNHYNSLMCGEKLTFKFTQMYDDVNTALQKIIINSKSYTAVDGIVEIVVGDEDIYAEIVFNVKNTCSVTVNKFNTQNNNGNEIDVDGYISYTYTNGGYNDYGRLYANSHLTFYADNANITEIHITYDLNWLNLGNNINALDNQLNVVKDNGAKIGYTQGSNDSNGQVTVVIPIDAACTALEYYANVCQARIVEITVYYQTLNTFGSL